MCHGEIIERCENNADSDDNLVSAYNKANDTEYNILPAENYSFTNKTLLLKMEKVYLEIL